MLRFNNSSSTSITQTDLNRGITPEVVLYLKKTLIHQFENHSAPQNVVIPWEVLREMIQLSKYTIECPVKNLNRPSVGYHKTGHTAAVAVQDNTENKKQQQDDSTGFNDFNTALENIYQDYIKKLGF